MPEWLVTGMKIAIVLIIGVAFLALVDWITGTGIGVTLTNSIKNFFASRVPASF